MGLFQKLSSLFSGSGGNSGEKDYVIYVRGRRCKEYLSTRIFLNRDLSEKDEGGYITRKTLAGTGQNRCFERVEVILHFDERKNVVDKEIIGGEFVTAEAYEAGV